MEDWFKSHMDDREKLNDALRRIDADREAIRRAVEDQQRFAEEIKRVRASHELFSQRFREDRALKESLGKYQLGDRLTLDLVQQGKALSPDSSIGMVEALARLPDIGRQLAQNIAAIVEAVRPFRDELGRLAQGFVLAQQAISAELGDRARVLAAALGDDLDPVGIYEAEREVEAQAPDEAEEADSADAAPPREAIAELESRLVRVGNLPLKLLDRIAACPDLLHGVTPEQFEEIIAGLLSELGFEDVRLTPRSGDGGRDIIAARTVSDIPVLFAFECKRYSPDRKVGVEILRALLGTITHGPTQANKGVLVTTSSFTRGAKHLIVSEARLDGKDFADLVKWLESSKGKPEDGRLS